MMATNDKENRNQYPGPEPANASDNQQQRVKRPRPDDFVEDPSDAKKAKSNHEIIQPNNANKAVANAVEAAVDIINALFKAGSRDLEKLRKAKTGLTKAMTEATNKIAVTGFQDQDLLENVDNRLAKYNLTTSRKTFGQEGTQGTQFANTGRQASKQERLDALESSTKNSYMHVCVGFFAEKAGDFNDGQTRMDSILKGVPDQQRPQEIAKLYKTDPERLEFQINNLFEKGFKLSTLEAEQTATSSKGFGNS